LSSTSTSRPASSTAPASVGETGLSDQLNGPLFLFTLGLLTALGPFAIDMYLPAMVEMRHAFSTSSSAIQLTLSSFFVGLSLGQFVFGTGSDQWGRRRALAAGILMYLAGSAAASFAPSVGVLLSARFVQGLGAAAGIVVTRAAIRDVYSGDRASSAMTMVMSVMAIAPLIAPMLGTFFLENYGWRAIFYFMIAFGLVGLLVIRVLMPETLPPDRRQEPEWTGQLSNYADVLRDERARAYILCGAMNTATLFAYISATSFVFIEHFGLSPNQFSILFAVNVCGLLIGNALNSKLVTRLGYLRFLGIGIAIALSGALVVLALYLAGVNHFLAVAIPLFFVVACVGIVSGNALAGLLQHHKEHAGTASALFGVLQYGLGALSSAAVGVIGDHVFSMSFVMAMAATISLGSWLYLWFRRGEHERVPRAA
jgi:DHA1 family bicyclomycin/chloramphenicol resistance-like MFS transporter